MTSSSFEDNLAVLGYGGAWNLGGLECEEHNWVSIFGVGIHCTCTERERKREGERERERAGGGGRDESERDLCSR